MERCKTSAMEEQLEHIQTRLANAEVYLARNVNQEGKAWLHFDDWSGMSGHPKWMKNFMIPTTMKHRARMEKSLAKICEKAKGRRLSMHRKDRIS